MLFTQLCLTPCDPRDCSLPSFPVHHQLLELAQTPVHGVGDVHGVHLILCLSPISPPAINLSHNKVFLFFPNKSFLHIRWPKYWSFSFNTSPSNVYSRLISFRIDWFDLLAVQGALKPSPAPWFESISSSVLSLLYSPTLTFVQENKSQLFLANQDMCSSYRSC